MLKHCIFTFGQDFQLAAVTAFYIKKLEKSTFSRDPFPSILQKYPKLWVTSKDFLAARARAGLKWNIKSNFHRFF